MSKVVTVGSAVLLCGLFVAEAACIVKEDCVYTPKVGHPWRVTITAQVKKNHLPALAKGVAEACYSDAENTALTADDPGDQLNAALRNQLLGDAQLDCVKNTTGPQFTAVRCNPFAPAFDGIVQFKPLAGTCAQALENGLEGTPLKKNASCPDKPAASASASASGDAGTESAADEATAAAVPTTGGG